MNQVNSRVETDKAIGVNKETWNKRTMLHYNSSFYDKDAFAKAKNSLHHYELQALGDVKGKSLLHLQCHFGQDSLSWAHLGAKVTGVDISESAIQLAQKLSKDLDIPASFICSNVLDVPKYIAEKFDIIFTSYGSITWLPDLRPWARLIADRLKPNGVFYMVEFHPIAWMFDYLQKPATMSYAYAGSDSIHEVYKGTYAAPEADVASDEYTWNHSLSEVIQSLIDAGLTITLVAENNGSPYDVFPDMEKIDGLYYLKNQLYPTIFQVKARL